MWWGIFESAYCTEINTQSMLLWSISSKSMSTYQFPFGSIHLHRSLAVQRSLWDERRSILKNRQDIIKVRIQLQQAEKRLLSSELPKSRDTSQFLTYLLVPLCGHGQVQPVEDIMDLLALHLGVDTVSEELVTSLRGMAEGYKTSTSSRSQKKPVWCCISPQFWLAWRPPLSGCWSQWQGFRRWRGLQRFSDNKEQKDIISRFKR